MVDEITYICNTFEKRGPGDLGEKQVSDYCAEEMKKLGCDNVYVEGFKENPNSFLGWIYFTITFCFIALACYFFIPWLSIVFIALGLILCVLQFGLYKKTVDKFFPEKTGHNVAGFKKPTGEVKRRIIFNGHSDGAWEWPFKYKFTYLGFDLHMMVCFLGAFYLLGVSIAKLAGAFDANPELAKILGLVALVFVPFWFGLYFMWNEKRIVDGANDNLSGCYIVWQSLRSSRMKASSLKTLKSVLSLPVQRKSVSEAQRRGLRLILMHTKMFPHSSMHMIQSTTPNILWLITEILTEL